MGVALPRVAGYQLLRHGDLRFGFLRKGHADGIAQAILQHSGSQAVTPQMLSKFARTARQRIRLEGGGYRRDHLRALAQRVEPSHGVVGAHAVDLRPDQVALEGMTGASVHAFESKVWDYLVTAADRRKFTLPSFG